MDSEDDMHDANDVESLDDDFYSGDYEMENYGDNDEMPDFDFMDNDTDDSDEVSASRQQNKEWQQSCNSCKSSGSPLVPTSFFLDHQHPWSEGEEEKEGISTGTNCDNHPLCNFILLGFKSKNMGYKCNCSALAMSVTGFRFCAKQKTYTVWKEEDIRQRQEDDIARISAVLSIPKVAACILLRRYNWDLNNVYEAWFADEDGVRKAVGLLEKPVVQFRNEELTCGICFERYPLDGMRAVACGHPFCVTCWTGLIEWDRRMKSRSKKIKLQLRLVGWILTSFKSLWNKVNHMDFGFLSISLEVDDQWKVYMISMRGISWLMRRVVVSRR
ncbi:unnamed protein product [Ilex paraguariensis]|uniref:E3 ubiquitin-protein ligase ARIH1-like UBA-like domain-containing protein n=1 Tax=Ilex paraguariensis TaxID=185542 RepID=A0ABC8RBP0_9AQUA